MKSFFLTLFSLICFSVSAQVDSFQKDIIEYLNTNGTHAQYSEAYDGMFDVLKKNFSEASVPDDLWKTMTSDKEKSVQDAIAFLSFAYRNHFTQDEIGEMTKFYKSEVAQKLLKKESLTPEENKEINAYYSSPVAIKVDAKRQQLSEEISEISSHWSRDLFTQKMSSLMDKGYNPKM